MDLRKHAMPRKCLPLLRSLKQPEEIVDIGPGIRPFTFWTAPRRVCVEPSEVYAGILRGHGHEVVQCTALEYLRGLEAGVDTVVMIDVIEHMQKHEGAACMDILETMAAQAVIYTPNGFVAQDEDEWGLEQDCWQTHRSGWEPGDFPRWRCHVTETAICAVRP